MNVARVYAWMQTLLLCAFAAAVLFDRSAPLFLSPSMRAAGSLLCVAGVALMAFALIALRNVVQISPEPRPGGELVTRGIYRRLRHPIYTAIVLLVVGMWLRVPTLSTAVAGAVVIVFLFVKVRVEERLLEERYPGYAAYRKTSWGLIPGLPF